MTKQVAEGVSLLKQYKITEITGAVANVNSWTEAETTGSVSGGGGITVGGTDGTAPVSGRVETKLTRYQTLMINGDDGKAYPVKMKNFEIPCTPDQKVTVFKIGEGEDAPVIHGYNYATGQHYQNDAALNWAMFPFLIFFGVLAVIVFLVWNWAAATSSDGFVMLAKTFIASGLIGLVVYGIAHIFAMVRSGRVRGNAAFKKRVSELSAG
jgi:hypothetical protein